MVHIGATTVESIPNDNYSIHAIINIVACFIWFPANIWVTGRCKTAFGDMNFYAMNIFMLSWFQLINLDANYLITKIEFIFTSM